MHRRARPLLRALHCTNFKHSYSLLVNPIRLTQDTLYLTSPPFHNSGQVFPSTFRPHTTISPANPQPNLSIQHVVRPLSSSMSISETLPQQVFDSRDFSAIVMDIEGTVAPISFVADVLFPYAEQRVSSHLTDTWTTEETQKDVEALLAQSLSDEKDGFPGLIKVERPSDEEGTLTDLADDVKKALIESLVANVKWQMSLNRKTSALKGLQGHIWRQGFVNGALKGDVYDDVLIAMKRWGNHDREKKLVLAIYSSGSVEAQKLLFKYSRHGSMSEYLSGYYDTAVGHKRERDSYTHIAKALGLEPSSILFLTDIYEEAVAAKQANYTAGLVLRQGNAPLPSDHGFITLTSFDQIA